MKVSRTYDPNKPIRPRTEKQKAAQERNWKICQLRMMWHMLPKYLSQPSTHQVIKNIIDTELILLRAETEWSKQMKRKLAWTNPPEKQVTL